MDLALGKASIWIAVCTILTLLIWWYGRDKWLPPGPKGFPILGVIPFLHPRPEIKFYDYSRKYGPIYTARVGSEDWVILNSYESINGALVKQGRKFSDRPPNYVIHEVFKKHNQGLLFSSGKVWETQRNFGNKIFRMFGVGKGSFESSVQEEALFFREFIAQNKRITKEWRVDVSKAVSNVICRVIFGKRFEYTDEDYSSAFSNSVGSGLLGKVLNIIILFPVLRFFPPFYLILMWIAKRPRMARKKFLQDVEDHRAQPPTNSVNDFIDAYLVQQQQEKKEKGCNEIFTDSQLMVYIADLFGAGTETSSSTLIWCFLGFLHYPHYQKRIQREIQSVIQDDMPSVAHRDLMPFTQAYLQEILRYCTLAPFGFPHYTSEDVELDGFTIPKHTHIIPNIWSVHNDPKNFEEPEKFRPERFIDENGNFIKSNRVIPFLIGPRHCIGEQLAKMELFIFLTSILQRYSVEKAIDSSPPAMDDGVMGIAYVSKPYKAAFVPLSEEHSFN